MRKRQPDRDEVARRAYEISQSEESKTDEENWARAERELRDKQPVSRWRRRRAAKPGT